MAQACLDGTYKFSCYCEKLMVKKRNKYPRVLSIPAMKDRLVLGITNQYLQAVYKINGCHQPLVNEIIQSIHLYLQTTDGTVFFLKTDFSNYYGTIRRKALLKKLNPDVAPSIVKLIEKAISTPTIPKGMKSGNAKANKYGIPQGLSISNILAFLYLFDFDEEMAKSEIGLYKRYVDDMLFLNPLNPISFNDVKFRLSSMHLNVIFSKSKVKKGILDHDELKFLGYNITKEHIQIPKENVSRYITRITGLVKKINGYKDKRYRPKFLDTDEKYVNYAIELLNIKLSGFRINGDIYGWIPYYQSITEISVLYGLDRILKNKIMKDVEKDILCRLHSLVDTYHDIKKSSGRNTIRNFDDFITLQDKRAYLLGMGYVLDDADDKEVSIKFEKYKANLIRDNERNIGPIS